MAELADAADLKSAALKRGVGVRVPLSAPSFPISFQRFRKHVLSAYSLRTFRVAFSAFHAFRAFLATFPFPVSLLGFRAGGFTTQCLRYFVGISRNANSGRASTKTASVPSGPRESWRAGKSASHLAFGIGKLRKGSYVIGRRIRAAGLLPYPAPAKSSWPMR
jgi:hypothetical protein